MTVKLTRQDAENRIAQINDARDQAVAHLQRLSGTQEHMLASGWQGHSATTYGQVSNQHNEEFHGIIQQLNTIVDLGSHHMRSLAAADENS